MENICRVKAVYDFEKSNTDELSFGRGDVIIVTQKLEGGWWEGTLNDETGWFPVSFVTEHRQEAPIKNGPVHDPRREYRAMVLRNIIDSERKHVSDMQTFYRSVLYPIKTANLLPESDFNILCGNFEEIIQIHESFICQFDDIVRTPSEQQTVGGVFMSAASALRSAHMKYCANHPRAVQTLNQYRDILNTFCEPLVPGRPGIILLTAELSRPFRRLDKYPNMLQELERHLEEFHFDRGNTQRAVMVYTEIANSCGEIRRQKEIELEILKGNIKDYQGPELSSLGDILLMLQVGVQDEAGGPRQERFLVVFEDCFVILAASARMSCFLYMAHSSLSGLKVSPVDTPEVPMSFEMWSKTLDRKIIDCKDRASFNQCLEVLSTQITKMSVRPSVGKSNTLPKPSKLLSNGLPPSPPKGPVTREVSSLLSREQRFQPPIVTNPVWSGSCLRPYPPLRGELPSKEEKSTAVAQSPKLARKFSGRKTKEQVKSSKTDDQLTLEKTRQYENDALLLGVIDAYCISSKSRQKVTSAELLDSPHVLIAEDEKIFIEGSDGSFLEEKSLVDTVYAMRDELRDMSAEMSKLRKQLEEERKQRKQLEASLSSSGNGVNGERYSELVGQ